MNRINKNPKILKEISMTDFLKNEPFFLYDVGVGGGIGDYWFNFGDNLRAIGFDADFTEIDNLNKNKKTDLVQYHQLAIRDVKSQYFDLYSRFSSTEARNIKNGIYSNNDVPTISIDEYSKKNNIKNVDFIKIDTDGYDLEVIKSSINTLKNNTLGLLVECQFHGSSLDKDNTFANISQTLSGYGYTLFDIDTWRYSRSSLPTKFSYNFFGQNEIGQVVFADALFLKDYSREKYSNEWGELSLCKQLKLVTLFELFGLPDCAAELLLKIKSNNIFDSEKINDWLNYLANHVDPTVTLYEELIDKFKNDPDSFLTSD